MSWADSAGRILAVSLLALVIGWFYGRPLEAVLLTVTVLGAGWLYQMHRVQVWLRDPDQPPPESRRGTRFRRDGTPRPARVSRGGRRSRGSVTGAR